MRHLILAAVAIVLMGTAQVAAQDASRGERGAQQAAPRRPDVPAVVVSDQPAGETRDELLRLLSQQYPPTLSEVLRLDPTLLTNSDYLALYPTLQAFLARHPEVARNPAYFLGGLRGRGGYYVEPVRDARWQAMSQVKEVIGGFFILLGFSLVVSLTAWGVKSFIDHRRWLRVSKIQTEAHSKLLDRLTSNEDLLAYIQSPAGRQFLEASPLPALSQPRPSISAPVNRILWSVQAGVVLALGGAGLWYSRSFVIEEMGQPLAVLGLLNMFVGAGFVLSSFVAYGLSKMLGLFDAPELRPHA